MKLIKCVVASLLLVAGSATQVQAAEDLNQLLQQVRQSAAADKATDQQRLKEFKADAGKQAQLLQQAQDRLAAADARQAELKQQFDRQEDELAEKEEALRNRSGQLGEVFGVVKQSAQEFRGVMGDSMISAEYPERLKQLDFADNKRIPTVTELETLWFLMQQEMTASGEIKTFSHQVVQPDGSRLQQQVLRVGPFTAINEAGQYLSYQPDAHHLNVIPRQPDSGVQQQAAAFFSGSQNTLVVDPSRGNLLKLITQTPTIEERIHQGGLVGYIIIALGALGAIVAIWRLLRTLMCDLAVRRQMKNSAVPKQSNPLGRILLSARKADSRDDMELRIDEALLQEVPRLESGLSLLKLLAAVAPLLGLLGTVTGMIGTFQSITLFGTGDPKLMAGGISQALITTVLGLCVAIPLLFCHTLLAARSKRMLQRLQQKSLALLIDHTDRGVANPARAANENGVSDAA